jgi:hypothetical protein
MLKSFGGIWKEISIIGGNGFLTWKYKATKTSASELFFNSYGN